MDFRPFANKLKEICRDNDISMLGVFGSAARGEDTASSDIDLLVRLRKPVGLISLIKLEDTFASLFGRKVDLALEGSIHPLIKKDVVSDLMVIYEE